MFGLCEGFRSKEVAETGATWLGIGLRTCPVILVEVLSWVLAMQTGGRLEIK